MKRAYIGIAGLLAATATLSACDPSTLGTNTIPAPVQVAERTILDEQIGIGAEASYKLFRLSVELSVKAGVIKGGTASQFIVLDNRLFAGLQAIRAAYATGNAATLTAASQDFNKALNDANEALDR